MEPAEPRPLCGCAAPLLKGGCPQVNRHPARRCADAEPHAPAQNWVHSQGRGWWHWAAVGAGLCRRAALIAGPQWAGRSRPSWSLLERTCAPKPLLDPRRVPRTARWTMLSPPASGGIASPSLLRQRDDVPPPEGLTGATSWAGWTWPMPSRQDTRWTEVEAGIPWLALGPATRRTRFFLEHTLD